MFCKASDYKKMMSHGEAIRDSKCRFRRLFLKFEVKKNDDRIPRAACRVE